MPSPINEDRLDITPGTRVIHYMRYQNMTWPDALKEFIDNAIDQGATRIAIEFTPGGRGKGACIIEDNGNGCADLSLMIQLAARADSEETQHGQFGVGAKDAQIWAANIVHFSSVCQGTRYTLRHNWDAVLKGQLWEALRPSKVMATDEPSGMRIELRELLHRRPDRGPLVENLGRTYMPWLREGRVLLLKMPKEPDFTPIAPFVFPALLHQQTETIQIDGKTAIVTLGMIPPQIVLPWRGVLCIYGSRLITQSKRLGIPPEALSSLCGWAEFGRAWGVEKNKRDFTDDLTDLEDEVATRFTDLILRASQQQATQPLESLKDLLNARLKDFHLQTGPWRKARRPGPRGDKKKPGVPTGTGTPHSNAAEDQPGDGWRKRRFLSMGSAHLGVMGPRCQMIDDVVEINLDNPHFAEALSDPRLLQERVVSTIAIYLGTEWNNPQMLLPWADMHGAADRIFTFEAILLGMRLQRQVASAAAAD